MLLKVCLLLCVGVVLAKRRPPVAIPQSSRDGFAYVEPHGEDDIRGDIRAAQRARFLRYMRFRRQQQQQEQQPPARMRQQPGIVQDAPRQAAGAPARPSPGRGTDYDQVDDEGQYADDEGAEPEDSDTLYPDDDDDKPGSKKGGRGGNRKTPDRGEGGGGPRRHNMRNSHQDPYTDDTGEEEGAAVPSGEDKTSGRGGGDDFLPSGRADNKGLNRRMDCIIDRVNHCIEWCRLKPTDNRLRQNRDNEPCRYWKGDSKNKWMQSGVCRNGRCS